MWFFPSQEDPSWHGADLGLQLRGWQRGGQGAAVLLRGHRLPGPPALSTPCSQQIPLLLRPGAHFPSVRVKFLLKRSSVVPFPWKITDGRGTGMDSGCAGGLFPAPGLLPPSRRSSYPTRQWAPSRKDVFLLSSSFPPNLGHKPHFSSSKHFLSIPRKCFPVGTEDSGKNLWKTGPIRIYRIQGKKDKK